MPLRLGLLAFMFVSSQALAGLADCFEATGQRYGIAPELLLAIAQVESNLDACAVNQNRDGSMDVGLMQINSWWFVRLEQMGIAPESLWDACQNIEVAGWILAGNLRRYGSRWVAVGAYNAGTATTETAEKRRATYANKVAERLAVAGPDRVQQSAGCS